MAVRLFLSMLSVLAVIYVVPLALYGAASRFVAMPAPAEAGAARFLIGVLVTKTGTAAAFVGSYWLASPAIRGREGLFAVLWLVMFVASEVGETLSRRTTSTEALIGMISEGIYVPISVWVVGLFLLPT